MLYIFALAPVVLFVAVIAFAVVRWQLQVEAREAALEQVASNPPPPGSTPAPAAPSASAPTPAPQALSPAPVPIATPSARQAVETSEVFDEDQMRTVAFSDTAGFDDLDDVTDPGMTDETDPGAPLADGALLSDEVEAVPAAAEAPEAVPVPSAVEEAPAPARPSRAAPAPMSSPLGLDQGLGILPQATAEEHPEHGTIVPVPELFDEDAMATVLARDHALDDESMKTVIHKEPEPTTFSDELEEDAPDGPGSLEETYRLGAIGALARHLAFQKVIAGRAWSIDYTADRFVVGTGDDARAWPLHIVGRVGADGRFHWAWADRDAAWSDAAVATSSALRELVVPELRQAAVPMDDKRRYLLFVCISTLDGRPWFYAKSESGGLLLLVDERVEVDEATLRKALTGFKMLGPPVNHLDAIDGAANLLALDYDYDGQIVTLYAPDGEVELRFDAQGHCVLV